MSKLNPTPFSYLSSQKGGFNKRKSLHQNTLHQRQLPNPKLLYSSEITKNLGSPNRSEDNVKKGNKEDYYKYITKHGNSNKFNINFFNLFLRSSSTTEIKLLSLYKPLKIEGLGSFGLVIHAVDIERNKDIAIKIINKRRLSSTKTLYNEINILKNIEHEHILRVYNTNETDDYFYIFMEHIPGGTLKELIIERYNSSTSSCLGYENETRIITQSLLETVKYLHENGIVHRDINPDNIMFRNKNDLTTLVGCDFGGAFSQETNTNPLNININNMRGYCGTLIYNAPEIFGDKPYTYLVDLFSCGVILFLLLSGGVHPFFENDLDKKSYKNNLMTQYQAKLNKIRENPYNISHLALKGFEKLCAIDPFLRYDSGIAGGDDWFKCKISNKNKPKRKEYLLSNHRTLLSNHNQETNTGSDEDIHPYKAKITGNKNKSIIRGGRRKSNLNSHLNKTQKYHIIPNGKHEKPLPLLNRQFSSKEKTKGINPNSDYLHSIPKDFQTNTNIYFSNGIELHSSSRKDDNPKKMHSLLQKGTTQNSVRSVEKCQSAIPSRKLNFSSARKHFTFLLSLHKKYL